MIVERVSGQPLATGRGVGASMLLLYIYMLFLEQTKGCKCYCALGAADRTRGVAEREREGGREGGREKGRQRQRGRDSETETARQRQRDRQRETLSEINVHSSWHRSTVIHA